MQSGSVCRRTDNTNVPKMNPNLHQYLTGTDPVTFHLDLKPGNYNITVDLEGCTSIQAEARRYMFEFDSIKRSKQYFTVNVREPEGMPTGQMGEGTPGLDLVFNGTEVKVNGLGVKQAKNASMIYLAGDSTVCDWTVKPKAGWGQMLPEYFKIGTCIANYADSGESTGSYLTDPTLFATMLSEVRVKDYVLIQFGHNDKDTSMEDYQENLISMVMQIREKGAVPVLVTPAVRRRFDSDSGTLNSIGLHVNNVGVDLPAAMREVAETYHVKLIDLTEKSKALVESLGIENSKQIYLTVENDGVDDNTHFSQYGANEMAKLVIQGMKDIHMPQIKNLR